MCHPTCHPRHASALLSCTAVFLPRFLSFSSSSSSSYYNVSSFLRRGSSCLWKRRWKRIGYERRRLYDILNPGAENFLMGFRLLPFRDSWNNRLWAGKWSFFSCKKKKGKRKKKERNFKLVYKALFSFSLSLCLFRIGVCLPLFPIRRIGFYRCCYVVTIVRQVVARNN